MKKRIKIFVFLLFSIFVLSGCSSKIKENTSSSVQNDADVQSTKEDELNDYINKESIVEDNPEVKEFQNLLEALLGENGLTIEPSSYGDNAIIYHLYAEGSRLPYSYLLTLNEEKMDSIMVSTSETPDEDFSLCLAVAMMGIDSSLTTTDISEIIEDLNSGRNVTRNGIEYSYDPAGYQGAYSVYISLRFKEYY